MLAPARRLLGRRPPRHDARLLRHAMELSLTWDACSSATPRSWRSARGRHAEGAVSQRLGLRGIPRERGHRHDRDVRLAGLTGARLHIAHVSSRHSVEISAGPRRPAQGDGRDRPATTALDDGALTSYDSHKKMNPPLREQSTRTRSSPVCSTARSTASPPITRPHRDREGARDSVAPFGVTGLETLLAAVLTRLVPPG